MSVKPPPPFVDLDSAPELELPQRSVPPLLLSLLLHVIVLTAIGLIYSRLPQGTGGDPDRPIGIAFVHRLPDRDLYTDAVEPQTELEAVEAESSPEANASAAMAPPADIAPPIDLNGVLQAMQSTPSPTTSTGLAGDAALGEDAFGSGTGAAPSAPDGKTTTTLFGVSGTGSRFVYVFDRSDSMNGYGGRPLRAAKLELIRSLKSLSPRQQFQLIFYNDEPRPFQLGGQALQLLPGDPSMLARAEQYVSQVTAFGGTEHDSALKMALRMAPDVIFFLTDARIPRLSGPELMEIRRRAERSGTTIHAVEFGTDTIAPYDSFLRDLAAQNGGQYQYVNVQRLQHTAESP